MMMAIQANKPLLYFPGVDMFDILIARAAVEIASGTLVVVTLLSSVAALGFDITPNDMFGFFYSLLGAWAFGVSTGIVFGTIGILWIPMFMAGSLLTPLFWISSGILYIPEAMPEQIQAFLRFLPLCHIVDHARSSFFSEYSSSFFDPKIMYTMMLAIFFLGIIFIPIVRKVGSS